MIRYRAETIKPYSNLHLLHLEIFIYLFIFVEQYCTHTRNIYDLGALFKGGEKLHFTPNIL